MYRERQAVEAIHSDAVALVQRLVRAGPPELAVDEDAAACSDDAFLPDDLLGPDRHG
jgi:hypothetical protein